MFETVKNEKGAVLVAGLMILVVLSILGISTMQTSTIQEKMANNMGQRNLAFQAAEAALRTAESRLDELGIIPTVTQASGTYVPWEDTTIWTGTSSELMSDGSDDLEIDGVAEQPRYIYEDMGTVGSSSEGSLIAGTEVDDIRMYRVTARGIGGISGSVVMLQSTYAR